MRRAVAALSQSGEEGVSGRRSATRVKSPARARATWPARQRTRMSRTGGGVGGDAEVGGRGASTAGMIAVSRPPQELRACRAGGENISLLRMCGGGWVVGGGGVIRQPPVDPPGPPCYKCPLPGRLASDG